MILEAVILPVIPARQAEFETAFRQASPIIAGIEGYISHELQRCIEVEGQYILLVRWETLEAHTVTFRQSAEYQKWKALLHQFYDPFPMVYHYENVDLS
jgi:heme-degrading monooxygenase HmoA